MPPISIDLLLHCQWVLPVVPHNQILQDHSVAIEGGRIIDILPTTEALQKYHSEHTELLDRHILMPGLVNTHCHSSARLARGIENTIRSNQGQEQNATDLESLSSDPQFIADSINIAIAEMIKTGTTCFAEIHSAGELFIEIARKLGIRSQASFILQERASAFGNNAEDYLHRGLKLRDNHANHPLIKVACGLTNIGDIEDTTLERLGAYANELDLPIQIQCNESLQSIESCYKKTGLRPLQRLNNMGLLLPETQLAMINYLSPEDRDLLHSTNNPIVICPQQDLAFSGKEQFTHWLSQAANNLSLGTYRAADLMAQITAAANIIADNQRQLSQTDAAHQALRMATINGAITLGWNREIGSIESGKYADLIAVEIDSIHHQPLYNPATELAYNSSNSPVTHSWVAAQPLLKDGNLCTVDEQKLIQSAKNWGNKLSN